MPSSERIKPRSSYSLAIRVAASGSVKTGASIAISLRSRRRSSRGIFISRLSCQRNASSSMAKSFEQLEANRRRAQARSHGSACAAGGLALVAASRHAGKAVTSGSSTAAFFKSTGASDSSISHRIIRMSRTTIVRRDGCAAACSPIDANAGDAIGPNACAQCTPSSLTEHRKIPPHWLTFSHAFSLTNAIGRS